MDELTSGLQMGFFFVLIGVSVILGVFCGVSILVTVITRTIIPRGNAKRIALMGSALVPMTMVLLFLMAFSTALEPDFRGPEVLGIAIVGIVAAFSVIVGWPVSYRVTRRVLRDR